MKKAKVLLIAPNMVGMSDGLNRIQPSLGLMLMASVLIEHGHEVRIHDTGLAGWENRRVIDPIKDPKKVEIGQSDEDIKQIVQKNIEVEVDKNENRMIDDILSQMNLTKDDWKKSLDLDGMGMSQWIKKNEQKC